MTTTADPAYVYGLREPCNNCPFRRDVTPYLRSGRAVEIAAALRRGGEFLCHKTTVTVTDDQGDDVSAPGPRSRFCAGAMATMMNEGQPNQMMRIAERFGWLDLAKLITAGPLVYGSLAAWVASYAAAPRTVADPDSGELLPFEHCGVVDDNCVDPAGYGGSGGYAENADPPSCNPLTDCCSACGRLACPACRSTQWDGDPMTERLCVGCAQDGTDWP